METITSMRVFSRVVESGSFSAAGRQLGMAPSSISRRIDELEGDLDARLFNRTTRKLSLTEAGQIYHERVVKILLDIEEAKLAVSQDEGQPSGVLRLTVPSGIGREVVASALPAFQKRYPAVQMVVSMSDQLIDMVDAGFDLAIRVGKQRDSGLIARKIGMSRRFVCGSPSYLKRAGTPKSPHDLIDHNCLTFRDHPGSNIWTFKGPDGTVDVRASGSLFAKNADLLTAAAVSGLGLILLPDWNIGIELRERQLREVLSNYRVVPETSAIYAVYPHQRYLPSKVRAFVDFLADHFSDLDPADRV